MNVGGAINGLFYAFVIALGTSVTLAIYVFFQAFWGFTPWNICVKMETDAAKVLCMEAHYK